MNCLVKKVKGTFHLTFEGNRTKALRANCSAKEMEQAVNNMYVEPCELHFHKAGEIFYGWGHYRGRYLFTLGKNMTVLSKKIMKRFKKGFNSSKFVFFFFTEGEIKKILPCPSGKTPLETSGNSEA